MKRATVVLLISACWSKAPSKAPEEPAAVEPARLVAARDTGIYELTADGHDVRWLSAAHASALRWQVPGKRLVFLTRETGELRALDIATGKEQLIARVRTTVDCPSGSVWDDGTPRPELLDVQDDDDFQVLPTRACLRLMDRNMNMASYILDVRVDLTTGKTTDALALAPDECKLPRREAPDACGDGQPVSASAPASALNGDAESGEDDSDRPLVHAGPSGFTVYSWSPSRRWVLLRGNDSEGDYMHFQVVLYEIATRRSFPVIGDLADLGGAWPAALRPEQLALGHEHLYSIAGDVVSETPIYWLEGRGDRLVVGDNLVLPGVRIAHVGKLAR